jgi:acyl-CoA synthetase (AMP-forming)/AMP-acid ligase II
MAPLLHLGQVLQAHAHVMPERTGAADLERRMSFRQWNARACRLANALLGLGLTKGDRVAMLAYNRVEWLEIYAAVAKSGLIAVPVNFRLVAPEIRFIVENCEARALIVEDALLGPVEEIRLDLPIERGAFVHLGSSSAPAGYVAYEDLIAAGAEEEPDVRVAPGDPWTLMYTSGTTGNPKGAIRSHGAGALLSLTTEVELGFSRRDTGLLVMPMCHANSLFFLGALTYCGAPVTVYSRPSFDPEHLLRSLANGIATFTSLVPTHYVMMLGLGRQVLDSLNPERITKLMISSAPARRDTKQAILDYFHNSRLWELYGSTEQGWATMLQPEDQFSKLGSVGRECVGSAPIRLLDEEGREVRQGEVGELYSATPYAFDGYWKLPEKTAQAFRGEHLSVDDLAWRDEDGFYYLVDRKSNMIITGGENVYPSEVENVLGAHAAVKDVAVIGVPDAKWGERVQGVVVLHAGAEASEEEFLAWCRENLAGYKRPRSIAIIAEAEMPRNTTGKILHRALRDRFAEKDEG